ncbi:major histocompatibility complex class I-related gene protein-like isoform X2 [Esox lucius]|uniref:major histocompatibility complex class I-related gene protein-like isoform X2 n=1 Tax=Esox lucius TaxID=8010 RepID=UPI001476F9A2|nr:major histocompatibility complex class I-related gene protein-like isoform X2 [Esox lucius]
MFISVYDITRFPGSGSHSLWALATYIIGETPFPEFIVVVMLDDVQVGYYDSKIKQPVYKGYHTSDKTKDDVAQNRILYTAYENMYNNMKARSSELNQVFNFTERFQVQQSISGCEMLDNGDQALIMTKNNLNSIYTDYAIYYNNTHFTYDAGNLLVGHDEKIQTYIHEILFQNVWFPICIQTLKRCLKREKNVVMRKVAPRLRLIKKRVSEGHRVTCLAFGFYPRHINLTLLRDGQPVAEQELTGGEVLPSGDGTYQMRKSLEVSTKELMERHQYSCTASHLSLDNKLDVSWNSEVERVHLSILSAPLVMVSVVMLLGIYRCVKWRTAVDTKEEEKVSSYSEISVN